MRSLAFGPARAHLGEWPHSQRSVMAPAEHATYQSNQLNNELAPLLQEDLASRVVGS